MDFVSSHPEVIAIAIEIVLYPKRRSHYSPRVLELADAAIAMLEGRLRTARDEARAEEETAAFARSDPLTPNRNIPNDDPL